MTKLDHSFSLRAAVEKAFAGIASVATVAVIVAGTIGMCFPGLGVV
jgi:hypothetical protein